MMNRDLTTDEVESLLSAASDDGVEPAAETTAIVTIRPAGVSDQRSGNANLDEVLSQRICKAMTSVGNRWCQSLQLPLRAEVVIGALEARLLEHSQLPGQFETPACIEVLDAGAADGYVLLQVDRRLVFVMIDRLLGGGRQPSPVVRRPLTEIETNLFQRLTEAWSREMSHWLSQNEPVHLRSLRVEFDPERVPRRADDQTVLVEMSMRVADQTGRFRIGLPLAMATATQPLSPMDNALADNLPLTGIAVIAGNVRVRNDEAHRLKVGETVFAEEALPRVYVDRKLMYTGRLGSNRQQKAVRIEDVVDGE